MTGRWRFAVFVLLGVLAAGIVGSVGAQCPQAPEVLSVIDSPGEVWGLAQAGSYLYVTGWNSGFRIFDVANAREPIGVGVLDKVGLGWRLTVRDGVAYVAAGGAGLRLVDVSNPTAPVLLGTADTPDQAHGVALRGDHAFVADHEGGLQVIRISDPTRPTIVGSVPTPEVARDVTVRGNVAYVAADGAGLQVVDISIPESPVIIASLDLPDGSWAVKEDGGRVYVAVAQAGLQIVDVNIPSSPLPIGGVDTPGIAVGVAVASDCVFVADYEEGMHVIDASNPFAPVLVSTLETPDRARRVVVPSNVAYVGAQSAGLVVVDLPGFDAIGRLCPIASDAYASDARVDVPVQLAGHSEPIREIGFNVKFEPEFVQFDEALPGPTLQGFDVLEFTELPGNVIRVRAETSVPVQPAGRDTLLTVRFTLVPGAEGETLVAVSDVTGIAARDCSDEFTIISCASDGDIDTDGVLSPQDAFCAFQCALGRGEMPGVCNFGTECEALVADVDCDDLCTAGDALWIFERYFCDGPPVSCGGQSGACPEDPEPTVAVSGLRLTIEPVPGPARVEVPVQVRGSGTLRAFGLELEALDGLPLRAFERAEPTEGWVGHGFGSADTTGTVVTLAGFDPTGVALNPDGWIAVGRVVVDVPRRGRRPAGLHVEGCHGRPRRRLAGRRSRRNARGRRGSFGSARAPGRIRSRSPHRSTSHCRSPPPSAFPFTTSPGAGSSISCRTIGPPARTGWSGREGIGTDAWWRRASTSTGWRAVITAPRGRS